MHAIFVVIYLLDEDLRIVLGDLEQFPFHAGEQVIVEYLSTVFGRKDYMEIAKPYGVMTFAIATLHPSILTWQGNDDAGTRLHPTRLRDGVLMRE